MKKIQPIILNYNLPEETDRLHDKLVRDGFTDIIVTDNGSDQRPPARSANFLLPKNIRATGQIKMALIYAMDYFPADYYWLITTSAVLLDHINYAQSLQEAFNDLKDLSVGVLSPALDHSVVMPIQRCSEENVRRRYSISFRQEMVASLVSHNLLTICRRKQKSYFQPAFKRGWGFDYDLQHEAVRNGLWGVITHTIPIQWARNAGYVKNVGGEDLEEYFKKAKDEMEKTLSSLYGKNWHAKMFYYYRRKVKQVNFPYHVDTEPDNYPQQPERFWQKVIRKLRRA